jgi:hypothetical protein
MKPANVAKARPATGRMKLQKLLRYNPHMYDRTAVITLKTPLIYPMQRMELSQALKDIGIPRDEFANICGVGETELRRWIQTNKIPVEVTVAASILQQIRNQRWEIVIKPAESKSKPTPNQPTAKPQVDLEEPMIQAIQNAAARGKPFTKCGRHGVHERRNELPEILRLGLSRDKIRSLLAKLLAEKKISRKPGESWLE